MITERRIFYIHGVVVVITVVVVGSTVVTSVVVVCSVVVAGRLVVVSASVVVITVFAKAQLSMKFVTPCLTYSNSVSFEIKS